MSNDEKQSVQPQRYSQTDLKEVMRTFWTDSHPEYGHKKKEAEALRKLFEEWPLNDDINKIVVKVSTLNALYGTRIFNIWPVVNRLAKLGADGYIDCLILNGDPEAVKKIRMDEYPNSNGRDLYSFATKYCHLSNPDAYPIYDALLDEILWQNKHVIFQKQEKYKNFCRKDLKEYETFIDALDGFKSEYKIKANCHDFDLYLWIIGKEKRKQAGEAENMVESE